ncbi:DUF3078 domain-containing protein [Flavobacterium sp. NRK F10]|uniref:DUF3078 domain-containing protein n=1 Tax=Flavobacterium sediminis TaxID=2201181 RepID=A0A2U8QT04_9FLAO|nr:MULTISPECIES: DUF3078 domain-containing protein [Flavobacterium]AWM13292.1 hypothetical protein DI487_05045 [Flavobacterium sediminis]MCO6174472.1 DUF3078 domain-containing protein [Flavobacterium sp. NRK F10]
MKKTFFMGFLALFIQQSFSQIVVTKLPDSTTYWTKTNKIGLDISQITFVNWNAGGNNSVSGLVKGQALRKYEKKNFSWNNELILRYGINKQEGQELRKTDDQIQINSTAGFRKDSTSNWFYGGKFTFNTQFANGYNYPNTDEPISKFFAPAYVFLGIGSEYVRKDIHLNLYLSPLTQKTTLVLDRRLADQGAFGVDAAVYDEVTGELIRHGRKSRTEIGILVTNQWQKEVYKNINLEHRLSLYTDYINKFGNIDVDWQLQLDMTVNQYVKANIGSHLIYDDDIKAKEEVNGEQITVGPKVQLKQILGVGVTYTF